MNWFKENKFLSGLIVFALIGAGVLGYLLSGARTKADDATASLEQTTAELKRLETLPVYPNAKNLKKLEDQREEHKQRIDQLQEHLAGMQLPVEPLTPEQFQDRLRETVTAYTKEATNARVAIPKGFYMGFDPYQSTPPKPEAAPRLSRELKAIDFLLHQFTANHVVELRDLVREPLPEEGAAAPRAAADQPAARGGGGAPGRRGANAGRGDAALLKKHTVDFVFLTDQAAFERILNSIVSAKSQFFIVRSVVVKNEKQTGPPREASSAAAPETPATPGAPGTPAAPGTPDAAAGTPAAPGAAGTPAAPAAAAAANAAATTPSGAKFEFIVGQEKIEVTMAVEIVDFAQTPALAPGKPVPPAAATTANQK